eukprot:TRINITY_DN8701_c0_g2_i2.p1 TRINITY_DN8701_c0_g2~~TRINITY_DN8701_c0_g2_i2.p1  ORF type:complete len:124 (+),score=14.94 TRINITY_DN8701_c0_g2_i2:101-472(+)
MGKLTKNLKMFGIVPRMQAYVLKYNLPAGVKKFLAHPAGPFTIFFWCGAMKWGISATNIGDLRLPPENISIYTQCALMATGLIWTRYCFVITPVNVNLAAANFAMFLSASYQIYRKWSSGKMN